MRKKNLFLSVIFIFLFSFFMAQSGYAGLGPLVQKYYQILETIEKYHVEPLTPAKEKEIEKIQDKAIDKILSLLDRHTMYFSEKEAEDFLSVGFEGIGVGLFLPDVGEKIERLTALFKKLVPLIGNGDFQNRSFMEKMGEWLAKKDAEFAKLYHEIKEGIVSRRGILVGKVFPGSGAEKEGIEKGWFLKKVGGEEVEGLSFKDAKKLILGPSGTDIELTFFVPERIENGILVEREREVTVKVKRGPVRTSYLESKILSGNTAYLRLTDFYPKTDKYNGADEDFREALEKFAGEGIKKYIIDLRNNPGGGLEIAHKITAGILPPGLVVGYQKYRDGEYYPSVSGNALFRMPQESKIVVLVNGFSASASELLVMALRDHKRAVIIGEKTFGKGSVQTLIQFPDKTELKITTGKFYSPVEQKCYDGIGIEPDIKISDDPETPEDEVIEKAMEILK